MAFYFQVGFNTVFQVGIMGKLCSNTRIVSLVEVLVSMMTHFMYLWMLCDDAHMFFFLCSL